MDTRTRNDLIWIVILAALVVVTARFFWEASWGTTIATAVLVSLGRLVYAWYARRTWR
jgi:hypothetical protein